MTNRVGQQLGNYRLVRLLGEGGQASVYLGEHLHLESHAAIKVLRTELSDNDVAKFLAEGQTLARLMHPQIMRVRDFAVEQGTPFLVMDYAPGGTLQQRHPYGTCLSLDTVVAYIKQMASALQYAHNHNVIHRDIKPENMLLGTHREVLISDFGIALFAPSPELLSTQEMAGTLPYMAPEQLRGKPCFASDQYALAIVVYEWLCGVRPFEGPYWQLLNQQASAPPPPLREKDPSLPEEIERVVLKALSKDPTQRYVSVQLFAQALEQASRIKARPSHYDSLATGQFNALLSAPSITPQQIFLSCSHADNVCAARLQSDLQRRGITFCNEPDGSTLDKLDQENLLRQAIRATDVVVLIASSHTHTSHIVKEYLRIAALYQRRLVCVWTEGEDLTKLLPETGEETASIDVIDAREPRYQLALNELVACLEMETVIAAPTASTLIKDAFEPRNPYKGLRAFTQEDTGDFFGREGLIAELVERVQERLRSEQAGRSPVRLLAVIGPSGSGKSSVVVAGLLPRLKLCALPGSEEWIYLKPIVPGAHPLETLALKLAPHLPDRSLRSIREDLADDSGRGLHLLAMHLIKGTEKKMVLFIDQFEEVFNLTTSEDERERFFDLLLAAITERKGPVLVILTFRADFYDRLLTASELGRLIAQYRSVIWPMEVGELRTAIKGPAMLPDVNLTFEGNLVGDLLYEVRGQVGALPLLQFTLDQLFERRKDHLLTQQAYQEIGGVKGALSKHAEKTHLALPKDAHRKLARTLFLRLIDPGITEQDTTRRRATLTELVFVDPEQTRLMQETLDLFVQARLLTVTASEGTETTIEVSHEALIREWPRLIDWLRTARDDIRLQHIISEDAAAWEHNKRRGDRLYRGAQLKEAKDWAKCNTTSKQEYTFMRASAVRQLRTFIAVRAVLVLVIILSGMAGWFVLHQPPQSGYVTTTDEYATGSLRWAIGTAHPGETITFAPSMDGQTIVLKNVDLHIFQNLTIQGPPTGHITIREIGASLIVDQSTSVTLSDLAFQGSKTQSQPSLLQNLGKLTIKKCTISGNILTAVKIFGSIGRHIGSGGGIYNSGTLTMMDSTVSGNTVAVADPASYQSYGGGIYNSGTLTMMDSTVSGNTVAVANPSPDQACGGGIYNSPGELTITNSTVSGNTATYGGGVYNYLGKLTITNSTVSGNTATYGGDIFYN